MEKRFKTRLSSSVWIPRRPRFADPISRFKRVLVLPDSDNSPALPDELGVRLLIAVAVAIQLGKPVVSVALGSGCVVRT